MSRRPALTPQRIVDAAVRVADEGGLARVSMRNVGGELGVEAMSLYHHVRNKDALLDALVEWVFERIALPVVGEPWRAQMVRRAGSARQVLAEHPWALGLIESRLPGPALLAHHESVLACLRADGFTLELAAHAFSALDAYVHGFVLTEVNLPFAADGDVDGFAAQVDELLPAECYPNMAEMLHTRIMGTGYDYGDEFDFGLELILDQLDARLVSDAGRPGQTNGQG
jgi:AcrR family transcriptional regulator